MKQETINKNKLQTLLCIIALSLGVLVSAVLFNMPPVHAAESVSWNLSSNAGTYDIHGTYNDSKNNLCEYDYHCILDDNTRYYGLVRLKATSGSKSLYDYYVASFKIGGSTDASAYYNYNEYPHYFTEHGDYRSNLKYYNCQGLHHYHNSLGGDSYELTSYNAAGLHFYEYANDKISGESFCNLITYDDFPLPVFDSYESMTNYCKTGDKNGVVSEPQVPNLTDESYTYTGFSINGKIARWTGTTERSFAKDVDVEEYVKVSYAWATTTEPDKLGELQSYEGEYATSDKQLTLPWSEMEKGKTDFQFIRQIKIFPCYRVPHLAYYIGQPVTIYYNTDGSIDKISNPNTPGVLDDSIPIPVLSVNNDKGTFLFANAQNNYKFELKGRFWSTDDFYVFRKMPSLVWQYKYLTLLKNSLTTWVSVGDNMSTLSTYSFGDLGKESWNDLLNTYPIENRNIITGEQQGWLSWANITGYNDAITTLKTLLSTPYSLFNGYEVYVRYYVVCDDGSIKYSKWTHYFNNLADADGSTGSIVDDASNMNNGSQSDKGLTDSDMDNVENSGNSRNDVDAKPSNDFSVEISDITGLFNQFINILKSLYSGMGQLPSLVNAIFGFLPSWASTMIGISLVVIIILRIIGR